MAENGHRALTKEEQRQKAQERYDYFGAQAEEFKADMEILDKMIADVEKLMNKAIDIGEHTWGPSRFQMKEARQSVGGLVWFREFYRNKYRSSLGKQAKASRTLEQLK